MKVLLASLMLVLSSLTVSARNNDLNGIQWTLTYANGRNFVNSAAFFEIDRSGSRFAGSTGCNRMFGEVDVRGRSIDFSFFGTTKMMCKLPAGSITEFSFPRGLDKADSFAVDGNILHLFDRSGRTIMRFMRLVKLPPVEPVPSRLRLGDKRWMLESIATKRTLVPFSGVFLNFDPVRKSVGGNSGCNVFGGEYSEAGSRFRIKDVVSTMRACTEDGKMSVERELFDGLRAADRYEIKDGRLFLYKGRRLLLTFRGVARS